MQEYLDHIHRAPGSASGIEHNEIASLPHEPEQVAIQELNDLEAFLGQHRSAWTVVRWIDVDGLDPHAIHLLATKYNLHPLAVEDMLQKTQRPKVESYFIPLTFLAGVYGMNFHYFPELDQIWTYPAFWLVCALTAGIMVWVLRRRHWL